MENIKFNKNAFQYKPKQRAIGEPAPDEYDFEDTRNPLGYVALPFPLLGKFDPLAKVPLRNVKALFKQKGTFGDIRLPLSFKKPTDIEFFYLPNMPMVSCRATKNVVITEISRGKDGSGRSKIGTVIEDIYIRNYDIDIKGVIIGEKEYELPTDEIAGLDSYFKTGYSLQVEHALLNCLGIEFIKILEIDLETNEGEGEHVQHYTIKAMSDEDFEKELLG